MYYSKEDAGEAVKVLFFEGAGAVKCGDVENCRIRTAFTNDKGEKIYLELWGIEVTKNSPERYKPFTNVAVIDCCAEISEGGELYRLDIERKAFEYSKDGILDFVNTEFNCSFNAVKILDVFDGYQVHKDGGGYNLIEDYTYNENRAKAARTAFAELDKQMREKLNRKYSVIRLVGIQDDGITVECYASNKEMEKHGLDPNKRQISVKF